MTQAATATPPRRIDKGLVRTAKLYRRVDHTDPRIVRHEAKRRLQVARAAGLWTADDPRVVSHDTTVATSAGHEIPVRTYRPVGGTGPYAAVMYLHGGAFMSGDLDFEHPRCLEMCRETGFLVVSVDYRLAPEFPYPAALEDTLAAYAWLRTEAVTLDADPGRLAVVGTSAGGALAAALCLRLRDAGQPPPNLQMLLHPVIDDRLSTPSMALFTDTPVWDAVNCAHMWNHYLGPAERRSATEQYAAPGRATDVSDLPHAYVMTAEYDPMRDEGAEYAARLAAAGVPTEFHQFPGAYHGFETLAAAPISDRARREHYDVLRAALG